MPRNRPVPPSEPVAPIPAEETFYAEMPYPDTFTADAPSPGSTITITGNSNMFSGEAIWTGSVYPAGTLSYSTPIINYAPPSEPVRDRAETRRSRPSRNARPATQDIYRGYSTDSIIGGLRASYEPEHKFKVGQTVLMNSDNYSGAMDRGTRMLINRCRGRDEYECVVLHGRYQGQNMVLHEGELKSRIQRKLPDWF